MTPAVVVQLVWCALILLLACAYRFRDIFARVNRHPETPTAGHAVPREEECASRWERDRHVLRTLLLAAMSAVSAWGWGSAALRLAAPAGLTVPLYVLFAVTLGWGLLSHMLLLLGLTGCLRRRWVAALLGAGVALAAMAGLPAAEGVVRPDAAVWSATAVIAALFCGALILMVLPACFAPPRGFDAHAYHLELPRRYAETGRIGYVPFMAHSPWPQAGHMLFVPGLLFGCAHIAQVMSALSGITLAALAFEAARPGAGLEGACLAALILLGVPELLYQMTEATVDVILALFTMASLIAWGCWLGSHDRSLLVLAGLFAGFACSTKMTALLLVPLLGAAGLAAGWIAGSPAAALTAAVAVPGVALLVASPWYIRSAWLTGNPFFHFATRLFPTRNWARSSEEAHRAIAAIDGWGPVRGLTGWGRYAWGHVVRSPLGWGSGLLALGPSAVLFEVHPVTGAVGLLALALALVTLALTDQIRLLLGAAAGMSVAAGSAGAFFGGRLPAIFLMTLTALIGLLAAMGGLHALHHKLRAAPSAQRRTAYLRRFLPYYDDFLWMNAHLPADARVLLWTTRGYLLERDYVWLPPWQQGVFDFTRITDSGAFRDELSRRGITHVYYTDREITRSVFSWLHDLHDEMVKRGLLVAPPDETAPPGLYRISG